MSIQPVTPQNTSWFSFRCPSCLGVLTVDLRLSGTSAPCPLCGAPIIAPRPVNQGIPFATLLGAQPTPFVSGPAHVPAEASRKAEPPKGRVVLVDGGLSQDHINRKDAVTTIKMIVFSILTAVICLGAAWLLLSS